MAVPAYWILGRSEFQGYVTARRSSEQDTVELASRVERDLAAYIVPASEVSAAGRAAMRLADMPGLGANAVELLIDGESTFRSILEGIDRAQDYILFQFYIVHDDELGRQVQAHLIARAKEGVRVYFLYNSSPAWSRCLKMTSRSPGWYRMTNTHRSLGGLSFQSVSLA